MAFPSPPKMLSTGRSSSWGLLSVTLLNPLGLGEESPCPGERCCLREQRQKFNLKLVQHLSPPGFPQELPSAEQAGGAESSWQLPAEPRRVRHSSSLYFPDLEAVTEVAAGLGWAH